MTQLFDKPRVLKAHLNTAVVLVSLEEGFVSAHTIVMACEELLRTWYVKKDIYVPFDYRIMIEDEYQRQYLDKIREKYNFFKHADRDIDAKIEVDPEEMHKLNEMMLGLTISGYRAIFSDATPAMNEYGKWFSTCYPNLIKWYKMPGGPAIKARLAGVTDFPKDGPGRRQILRVHLYITGVLPKQDLPLL